MKKYLLILTTLALLGGGCSKEEIPETTDGEGSVEFRTTTCSEVDSQTTRAQTSLPDNCKPSGNSFKLVVKGKEGTATAEYLAEYTTLSEYTAPFMPSGDYTATISYGDPQQEGSTAFCYQGALDFTILARKTIQKTITASLTNSVITSNAASGSRNTIPKRNSPSRPKRATISVSPTPRRPILRSSSSREANFCSKVRR